MNTKVQPIAVPTITGVATALVNMPPTTTVEPIPPASTDAEPSTSTPLTWEQAQSLPPGTKITTKKKPNSYPVPTLVRTKEGWNLISGVVHAPRKGDLTAEWRIVV